MGDEARIEGEQVMHVRFAAVLIALLLSAGSAAAQCLDKVGEGSGASREAALLAAYEAALKATDERLLKAWLAGARKLGDAPGYTVRKLTSNCTAGGPGQICRIAVTLCRN
jgi:hypothetical protein